MLWMDITDCDFIKTATLMLKFYWFIESKKLFVC
jgi:hypothetical protein